MSIKEKRECPRKAYLHSNFPVGKMKAIELRRICKEVVTNCDFSVTKASLDAQVEAAFTGIHSEMFDFEKQSECERMKTLLWRYITFEQRQPHTILAQNFSNKVKLMGEDHTVSCHRLIDRGSSVEAIKYLYKAPDMAYNSRSGNRPEDNPDLLALQKCGEEELKKLGVSKPCFGSFYYMKSKKDRAKCLVSEFEDGIASNIVNFHFEPSNEADLATLYKGIKENPVDCQTDVSKCRDCVFNDLCSVEFVKRNQIDVPEAEETPLNQIRMTPAQEQFVLFNNGVCRVNAVAGSGKTTIVVLRTLRLIEEGCDPSHILMITFTAKACEEMRSRLRRYANGAALKSENIDVSTIEVNTFNGFGQSILEMHYAELGFSQPPTLVDEVFKKDIVVKLLESHTSLPLDFRNPFLDMRNASGAVIQMVRIIDMLKAYHVKTVKEVEELVSNDMRDHAAELLQIYKDYNDQLQKANCLDYEDQLRLLLELKTTGIFKKLPYEHIIIDEFQDSDPNQLKLILEMTHASTEMKSLVVVGDEMQAIYGFRNATPENLVALSNYFPGMIDIPLEDNFRSQSPIIDMANNILNKEARISKVIRANLMTSTLAPVLRKIEKDADEYNLYVRQAKKLLANGTPPQDIAILCRTKVELLKIQKAMEDAGIPTILKVPEIVAEAPYVKAVIALASFLLDHSDLVSLAFYRKSLGLDPFDADVLKKEAEELGNRWDALTTDEDKLMLFLGMVNDAKGDFVAASFVDDVVSKGFHTTTELLRFLVKYKKYCVKETMSTAREDIEAVNLITVHSAKGLEWPIVFLSLRKFHSADEEEHRLLYVAVTRAKEKLLVTYPEKQSLLVSLLKA